MPLLIEAIEEFICHEQNSTKVITNLNNKYNLSAFVQKTIYNLFNLIKKYISQNYIDVNRQEKLVQNNQFKNVCIDESLFLHNSKGIQEWLIGLIEVESKKIRLEIVNERSEKNIKNIVFLVWV